MSTEIDPSQLRCNACWKVIDATKSYRTRCNHLYCRPCAERFFSKSMVCPVCDREVDGEFGVVELSHEMNSDIMTLFFSFAAVYPAEANNLTLEASRFVKEQIALYGTREGYLRIEETRNVTSQLGKAQGDLKQFSEENARLNSKLQELLGHLQEKDRQLKHTVDAYNQLKGVSSTPLAARRGSDIMSTSSGSTHGERETFSSKGLASISSALSIPKMHPGGDRSISPGARVPGGAGTMRSETPLSSRPRSSEASMRSMDILKGMAAARGGGVLATPLRRSESTPRGADPTAGYVQTKHGGVRLVQRPPTSMVTPRR